MYTKITEPKTKTAPTTNGTCGEYKPANIPAKAGAIAAPMNLKKLYDAEAVDVSIDVAFITAVVINVLVVPDTAPERMMETIITHCIDVQIPITRRITA